MEKRKTILDYIGEVFSIFGIAITAIYIFCFFFGDDAKEFSSMFSLGSNGISLATAAQYFLVSTFIVALRFVFFTDTIIKKLSIPMRTVCLISSVLILISLFIIIFDWFPIGMWLPWIMFIGCFGISFVISFTVSFINEKAENKRMEKALALLKKGNKKSDV